MRIFRIEIIVPRWVVASKSERPMINMYDYICANASLVDQMKFGKKGDIFIDYICVIDDRKARTWSHKNCLMYVVRGIKGYDTHDHYHESAPHQVLFIRKGGVVLHQIYEEPYRALIFMVDDSTIQNIISEYPKLFALQPGPRIDFTSYPSLANLQTSRHIQSIFYSALEYLKNPTPESQISLELKFKELVVNLIRQKESNTFVEYLSWLCQESEAAFIKLMRENCQNNFTVKELARIAGMSLSTFKREFVRVLGLPPGKWLDNQRMTKAYYYLLHTSKTISEIAFDLGYSDTSAFSRWFKHRTGQSPQLFRSDANRTK